MTQKSRRRRIIGTVLLITLVAASLAYWAYRRKRVDLDLLDAIRRRDVGAARAALSAGANPNAKGYRLTSMDEQQSPYEQFLEMIARAQRVSKRTPSDAPSTALMLAEEVKQPEIALLLLDHGANPNVRWSYGMTPLTYAADRGQTQVVAALLHRHADLNAHLDNGYTALTLALSRNHSDIAGMLLDAGADVKQRSATDQSPVLIAIATSTPLELLQRLLTDGANVNARNAHGETPLILTEQIAPQVPGMGPGFARMAAGVVRVFPGGGVSRVLTMAPGSGETISIKQLQQDRTDRVRALLAHGADVNAADRAGQAALMRAAERGSTEDVEMLLAHGAQVDAANHAGETALMKAVWSGALPCAQQLLAHGANVNRIDRSHKASALPIDEVGSMTQAMNFDSGTALMRASHADFVPMIQLLLAHGANVNQADPCGETALMRAAERGALEAVQLLLAHGADARAVDRTGRTTLMFAALSAPAKRTYSINSTVSLPPSLNRTQFLAQYQRTVQMLNQQTNRLSGNVRIVLNQQANRWPGGTPLQRSLQIMQMLLSHGADVNARDRHGDTVLKLAMSPGKPVPDPNYYMSFGSSAGAKKVSPLLVLVQRPEVVAVLKQAGARSGF